MASELDVDAHELEQVLTKYLRAHLAEMAEARLSFAEAYVGAEDVRRAWTAGLAWIRR